MMRLRQLALTALVMCFLVLYASLLAVLPFGEQLLLVVLFAVVLTSYEFRVIREDQ
jgi:hypothetical protein